MDITLDLQGHKVKTLDLQNFPYKSVTIKNGTINDIATSAPAVLILDSVTTSAGTLDKLFTLTVKGDCVFKSQVNFLGKTQLQGGTCLLYTSIRDTPHPPGKVHPSGLAYVI